MFSVWGEVDQELATGLPKPELSVEEAGLAMELGQMGNPAPEPRFGGFSDDIGDISEKDCHAVLPVAHPEWPRPPLGERGCRGEPDRAQGGDPGRGRSR